MSKKILVVDDEARLVNLVRGYLEQEGYEVRTAGDGRQALFVARDRLELLERTQVYAYDGYERTIDVHIKNLRKKIEPDSTHPQYILTAFGVGYRFRVE
ncbi:MAG TPA: winged helix family transcriptional regulator [Anaerolineae bacterium]|nr:winged helix family transcriptional regulator [Anaerolineae bacterium]